MSSQFAPTKILRAWSEVAFLSVPMIPGPILERPRVGWCRVGRFLRIRRTSQSTRFVAQNRPWARSTAHLGVGAACAVTEARIYGGQPILEAAEFVFNYYLS